MDIDADEIVTTIVNFEEQMRGWLSYLAKARTVVQQLEAYRRLSRHLEYYRQIPELLRSSVSVCGNCSRALELWI